MSAADWMRGNLTTQGYCLGDAERRELWLGLRFSTGLCLALVVTGLALRSRAMILALVPIGAAAGFTARHPFDYAWNALVRHVVGAPALPPNPARRRHAFKLATVWLAVVGVLLATGATNAGLVLGGLLVAACATVTATNLCLPSEAFALWERITTRDKVLTT
jgi:Tfp pilus assembly protein PilN